MSDRAWFYSAVDPWLTPDDRGHRREHRVPSIRIVMTVSWLSRTCMLRPHTWLPTASPSWLPVFWMYFWGLSCTQPCSRLLPWLSKASLISLPYKFHPTLISLLHPGPHYLKSKCWAAALYDSSCHLGAKHRGEVGPGRNFSVFPFITIKGLSQILSDRPDSKIENSASCLFFPEMIPFSRVNRSGVFNLAIKWHSLPEAWHLPVAEQREGGRAKRSKNSTSLPQRKIKKTHKFYSVNEVNQETLQFSVCKTDFYS